MTSKRGRNDSAPAARITRMPGFAPMGGPMGAWPRVRMRRNLLQRRAATAARLDDDHGVICRPSPVSGACPPALLGAAKRGATALEYGFFVAFVSAILLGGATVLADSIKAMFSNGASRVTDKASKI